MKFLLLIFLIAFIYVVVRVLIFLYRVFKPFHDVINNARKQADRQTYGQTKQGKSTRYGNDETIINNRSEAQDKHKIFSKNEGEYVDYQEE